MKRYDNGEIVTKERMEDEEWYSDYYQPFLEFAIGGFPEVNKMYESTIKFFHEFFHEELSEFNKQRILRWCVLHVERMGGQKFYFDDEKKEIKLKCPECQSELIDSRETFRRTGPPKDVNPALKNKFVSYGYRFIAHYCKSCQYEWEGKKI